MRLETVTKVQSLLRPSSQRVTYNSSMAVMKKIKSFQGDKLLHTTALYMSNEDVIAQRLKAMLSYSTLPSAFVAFIRT